MVGAMAQIMFKEAGEDLLAGLVWKARPDRALHELQGPIADKSDNGFHGMDGESFSFKGAVDAPCKVLPRLHKRSVQVKYYQVKLHGKKGRLSISVSKK